MARKLTYFVGCSVDGFIAAEDGAVDVFPTPPDYLTEMFTEWPETCPAHARDALGIHGTNRHFDTVLMGRATYQLGVDVGVTSPYPTLDQYVVSTSMDASPDEDVTLVSENVADVVNSLKKEPGLDVWLAGGAVLAGALHDEGLIDELVLKVYPVALGSGIPIFSGATRKADLQLEESTAFFGGVVISRYRVPR